MPSSTLKRPTRFLCVFLCCFHLSVSVIPFRYMPGLLLHPGTALTFLMFPPILNGPISTFCEIALLLFGPDPRGNSHNPNGKQPQYSSSQTFCKKQPVYHPKLLKATQTQGKTQSRSHYGLLQCLPHHLITSNQQSPKNALCLLV